MSDQTKIPTWFWVVAIVALVWNAMGLFKFFGDMFISEDKLAAMTEAMRLIYESNPVWVKIAYGLATIGGFLGCLLLVLKKTVAYIVLFLSLIGIVVQMYHSLFMIDATEAFGAAAGIMPIIVALVGIGLVWLAKHGIAKAWLK